MTDRQSDRLTDGRTHDYSICRASRASCGKNGVFWDVYGPLEVTGNSTIRQSACGFLDAKRAVVANVLDFGESRQQLDGTTGTRDQEVADSTSGWREHGPVVRSHAV